MIDGFSNVGDFGDADGGHDFEEDEGVEQSHDTFVEEKEFDDDAEFSSVNTESRDDIIRYLYFDLTMDERSKLC